MVPRLAMRLAAQNVACRGLATTVLSEAEVLSRCGSRMPEEIRDRVFSMFSSALGGIVVDPKLMMLPIDDHLVHRGHGVFDTANVADGRVYGLDFHLDRLLLSAERAKIPLPADAPDKESLRQIILHTVAASGRTDQLFVRYWLSAGRGNFSVSPAACETSTFYCVVHQDEPSHATGHPGISAAMVDVPLKPKLLANMKSNNYLLNALVAMEAAEKGADLGIQTGPDGYVTESSVSCVGMVDSNSMLLVPPFDLTLASTTLVRLFSLLESGSQDLGVQGYEQRPLTVAELRESRELLSFGGGWCVPVTELDGRPIGDGKPGSVGVGAKEQNKRMRTQTRLAYSALVGALEDELGNETFTDQIPDSVQQPSQ